MTTPALPLPPQAFYSGVCCPPDHGPLCPGSGNYQRMQSTLPSNGPQCVCYSNQTLCETLDRVREIKDLTPQHGGRLVKYCAKNVQLGSSASYNIPYFESISVNGTGDIMMWAELQYGAVGSDPITILTREYKTPSGDFIDPFVADDLNAVIQGMGEDALGTDLTLNWACTGGPRGEANLNFAIQGGVCLRPRLELVDGNERGLLTCIVGKLTPLPLGGCPGFGLFGAAPALHTLSWTSTISTLLLCMLGVYESFD